MISVQDEARDDATDDYEAPQVPMTLHEAIRAAYKGVGLTQEEVAERADGETIAGTSETITRTKLSKWSTGSDRPPLEALAIIEKACGRPKGWILHAAGYVDDLIPTIYTAVEMDPELSADARRVVIGCYESVKGAGRTQKGE